MNMLNRPVLLLILAFLSFSCAQEDSEMEKEASIKSPPVTIITDDGPLYSGYGYDPKTNRSYKNAIDPYSTFESTDIKEALVVEVKAIETREELERFTSSSYSSDASFGIPGFFSLGISVARSIEGKIEMNANHVSVIARIKSRSHKYICDRYPLLMTEQYNGRDGANVDRIIASEDVNRFISNYGPMYVDTRVVGGEIYYVYNYDYTKVNQWNKSTFRSKVTANIGSFFGINIGEGVTTEDKQLISSAEKRASITSTVPGYSPRIITDIHQINGEVSALQSYLNENPEKATTVEMNLRPYHRFLNYDHPSFATKMEAAYNDYIQANQ